MKSISEKLEGWDIEEFSSKNWDGYNAEPIGLDVYNKAIKIAKMIEKGNWDVVPLPDGSIDITLNDEELFININDDMEISITLLD